MLKTSALLLTLIFSALLPGNTKAKIPPFTFTVTCEFNDGLDWSLSFRDYGAALLYGSFCEHNQGGTPSIEMN